MKHLDEAGTRKKRPTSWLFFFLPAFGRYCAFGAARLRRAAPSATPLLPTGSPLLTARRPTHDWIDAYPRIALIRQTIWTIDRSPLQVGERWVNPLPDEASSTKWEQEKKDPLRRSFFSYRPLASTAPSAQHAFGALRLRRPPLPTGSPLRPARCPTHDWIDVVPIHVWQSTR